MSNVQHPRFSWRYKTHANTCVAVIVPDKQGQPWIHFVGDTGKVEGYFHPDDIDGVIAALEASKMQIRNM